MKRWLVVVALVVGCKKDASPTTAAVPSPTAPASTAELDALWAKAPADATVGYVMSPRAITMTEHAWTDVHTFLKAIPQFAPAEKEMAAELAKIGLSTDFTLADFGLAPGKGLAFFGSNSGVVGLLPVVDRDKFLAKVKGQKGTDGVDHVENGVCKMADGWYACATTVGLIDALGKGKLDISPAKARGDMELVVLDPAKVALVVQLDRGAFVVRGIAGPLPSELTAIAGKLGKPVKPNVDLAKSAGFAVLNIEPMLANIPSMQVFPDVDAREVAQSVTGPLTITMPAGDLSVDARVPLKDSGPMKKLLAHCEEIPAANAKRSGDHCKVPVPDYGFSVDVFVDGNELRVTTDGGGKAGTAPASAIGMEIANGAWHAAFWGHGTLLAPSKLQIPQMMTQEIPDEAALAIRAMLMLNEVGFGLTIDGDSARFVLSFRSGWANPDDVVAKIAAVPPDDVLAGKAGERGKAIADAAPKSPFASDYAAGPSGVMIPTAVIGILAAVAIPAYMDYMKKGKVSEAAEQLNAIGKTAKRYWADNGSFPKGKSASLPAMATCCGHGNNKCFNDPAAFAHDKIWSALGYALEQPETAYRYEYSSEDGQSFVATATADLDCDGQFATWRLEGKLENGEPSVRLTHPAPGVY